jgi:hypothetical protein
MPTKILFDDALCETIEHMSTQNWTFTIKIFTFSVPKIHIEIQDVSEFKKTIKVLHAITLNLTETKRIFKKIETFKKEDKYLKQFSKMRFKKDDQDLDW